MKNSRCSYLNLHFLLISYIRPNLAIKSIFQEIEKKFQYWYLNLHFFSSHMDASYIGCLKNIYKKWLNREILNGEVPDRLSKMTKICEISADMRPEVGQFCWKKTLYPEGIEEEAPAEVNAAAEEAEEENLQKLVHNLDQMFVAEEVPIGDDVECDNGGLDVDDDVELVELVEIPEEVPEKRKVQQKISNYFSAV